MEEHQLLFFFQDVKQPVCFFLCREVLRHNILALLPLRPQLVDFFGPSKRAAG